jgi:nicotinamide-nucleotide amidase
MDTNKILELNRNPELSSWFLDRLEDLKNSDVYHDDIPTLGEDLVKGLSEYRTKWNVENVFIGMSGGIDSALTAALFKNAGWNVTGLTLPIHQESSETERGIEACESLGIEHLQVDLTQAFESYLEHATKEADANLYGRDFYDSKDARVRGGNIRARLRMITLYNQASLHKGIVASTDNFSELAAGFWTLHGDVGDVAPIQSLTKSWEVPALSEYMGVPESIISAKPTDGLGVANGDEDQFGFSYLEFDIAMFSLFENYDIELDDAKDEAIVDDVKNRINSTVYKRLNPFNLDHPLDWQRYSNLSKLDDKLRR